jgi:hypothetical protein
MMMASFGIALASSLNMQNRLVAADIAGAHD